MQFHTTLIKYSGTKAYELYVSYNRSIEENKNQPFIITKIFYNWQSPMKETFVKLLWSVSKTYLGLKPSKLLKMVHIASLQNLRLWGFSMATSRFLDSRLQTFIFASRLNSSVDIYLTSSMVREWVILSSLSQ